VDPFTRPITRMRKDTFNYFLGKMLVQMARDWVKVDAQVLAELKRLVSKMPAPVAGRR
jgi:hypothetical protein